MKKVILFALLLAGACSKIGILIPHPGNEPSTPISNSKDITSFYVKYGFFGSRDSVICTIEDSVITGLIPGEYGAQENILDKLGVVVFTNTGVSVKVKDVIQQSDSNIHNFSLKNIYTVTAEDGTTKDYTIHLRLFSGLPILKLFPASAVLDRENYIAGPYTFYGYDSLSKGTMAMKGRGNSTWFQAKRPYKIKFDNKTSLFNFPSDKEWAVLANYLDKSLLRNDVAFELSERFQRAWTPRRQFVELFMANHQNGNYLLTETIKEDKNRVNIDTKNGGYLLEVNYKEPEDDPRFYTTAGIPVDVKEGVLPLDQIKSQVDTVYNKLVSGNFDPINGYQKDFDLDAFVSWYLVNEIMMNNDAIFYSSVYLQKDNAEGKLKMGPVWDFDLSSGNVSWGQTNPEGWYLMKGEFVKQIWMDPAFQAAVKVKWNKYSSQIKSIFSYIDGKAEYLKKSADYNFIKWNILGINLGNNAAMPGSYKGEVDYLKSWLGQRIAWMDKEINKR